MTTSRTFSPAAVTSSLLLSSLIVAVLSGPVRAQGRSRIDVPDGFVATDRFVFGVSPEFTRALGGLEFSPGGDPIVYENGEIRLHRGDSVTVLAEFDPPVFGSFLRMAPGGEAVLFGESSESLVHSVPLAGGAPAVADSIPFNFDLAFAPATAGEGIAGRGFVSALEEDGTNAIVLLDDDPTSRNDEIVTGMPTFSGPVTFDDAGNLYYVTAGADFFEVSGGTEFGQRMVRFSPAQLASAIGGAQLAFDDAEVVARNLDASFNMAFDGRAILVSTLAGAIERIDVLGGFEVTRFATLGIDDGPATASALALHRSDRPFEPRAGRKGGALLVAYGNFVDVSNVALITPETPFVRGEINGDGVIDISDAISILDFLFGGGDAPDVIDAADTNSDGKVDLSDAVFLLEFLFLGGARPVE